MKIKFLLFLFAFACALTSCFNNTVSQTTPLYEFGYLYLNPQFVNDSLIGAQDTLGSRYNEDFGMVYTDTVQLGDTVMFPAFFTSNMNNLVAINATFDTTRVNLWFDIDVEDASVKNALAAGSQPEKGILLFNPMHNRAYFPVYMVPMETGAHAIKITVTSDSQYPTNYAVFTLPVKS